MRLLPTCGLVLILAVGAPAAAQAMSSEAQMRAGLTHERRGEYLPAIEALTKAIDSASLSRENQARAMYDRGVAHDALGRTEDAIRDYSEAIKLQPDFSPALNNRANVYRRLKRYDDAMRDYWSALAVRGVAAEYCFYGMGRIAEEQGDIAAARDFYSKALKVNSKFKYASQQTDYINKNSFQQHVDKPKIANMTVAVRRQTSPHEAPDAKEPPAPPLRLGIVDGTKRGAAAQAQTVQALTADIKSAKYELNRLKTASQTQSQPRAGQVEVQLGAYRNQAAAEAGWETVAARAGEALAGRSPKIFAVDLPGRGRFYRLRLAAADLPAARRLCIRLAQTGQECLIAGYWQ
jgi:tetratricopeptide (TPR) repeat protein